MRTFESIVAVIGLIVIVLLAGWITWLGPYLDKQANLPQPIPSDAPFVNQKPMTEAELITLVKQAQDGKVDTTNWPRFVNKKYGYSFQFPPGLEFEGWTNNMDRTNPEVADRIYIGSVVPQDRLDAVLSFQIEAHKLSITGERCKAVYKKDSLANFIQTLTEESKKVIEGSSNLRSQVPPQATEVSYKNITGYQVSWSGLHLFNGCVSEDLNQIADKEIYRFFQEGDRQIQVSTGLFDVRPQENPLIKVILNTFKFESQNM